jgi:hypothetical protein
LINDPELQGQFADFYDNGMRYAPNYTRHLHVENMNVPGELRIMPTMFRQEYPPFVSVLIREDIAAEYGNEVRTASEYIELLEWLKARDPKSVPGATIPYMFRDNIILNFYMPEWGYWAVSHNCWSAALIGTNETRTTYNMPELSRAIQEFTKLWRTGYLYMKNADWLGTRRLGDFPTVLLYFYYFMGDRSVDEYITEFSSFDASGYRIYALYGGKMPLLDNAGKDYSTISGSRAVAGPNADVSEFLRLMEWLDNRENYISLMYGEEGEDYDFLNGRIAAVEKPKYNMAAVRQNLYFLERSKFNAVPITAPPNYEEEMERLIPAYTLTVTPDDYAPLDAVFEDDDILMRLNETSEDFDDLLSDLFLGYLIEHKGDYFYRDSAPTLLETNTLFDEFIEKQKDRGELLSQLAEAQEKVYKAAAERNRGEVFP